MDFCYDPADVANGGDIQVVVSQPQAAAPVPQPVSAPQPVPQPVPAPQPAPQPVPQPVPQPLPQPVPAQQQEQPSLLTAPELPLQYMNGIGTTPLVPMQVCEG